MGFRRNVIVAGFLIMSSFGFQANAKDVVLDVRTPKEYSAGHIPNALNVDLLNANFREKVSELSRQDSYKVYCRSGNRSGQAIAIMRELGFKDLTNLGSLENAAKELKVKPVGE
ncbi:rhodanese-like domain-containing protein [Bdellovibrio sp. ArHS]|uniref:rhodanese-like domain-containing protein n=1 Tax=Bdellovibrio sp. ArHS TaxID=1569284 RepID=UPI0025B7ADC2|nr:rhodanese-like domain-containing protein [Bdellovibrio sp. ArHS]